MAANKLENLHVSLGFCPRRTSETDAIFHDELDGKINRKMPSKVQNCTTNKKDNLKSTGPVFSCRYINNGESELKNLLFD